MVRLLSLRQTNYILWGWRSSEVVLTLLTHKPRVRFLAFPRTFLKNYPSVTEINQRHFFECGKAWIYWSNHLVLASGKLVLQKKQLSFVHQFCSMQVSWSLSTSAMIDRLQHFYSQVQRNQTGASKRIRVDHLHVGQQHEVKTLTSLSWILINFMATANVKSIYFWFSGLRHEEC